MSWKDEFDEKFTEIIQHHRIWGGDFAEPEFVLQFISSLLKKQRENCVERIYNTDRICKKDDLCEQCQETVDLILNTPEPE